MAYGVAQQDANVNCASTFLDTLEDLILAVSGWSLEDTYTNSTTTWKVFKSAAAQNGGVDFYLGLGITINTGSAVYAQVAELYDSGTHKFRKYVKSNTSTSSIDAADSTLVDATGLVPDSSTLLSGTVYTGVSPQAFLYWYSITAQRIVIGTRYGLTEGAFYAGMCENLINETTYPHAAVAIGAFSLTSTSKGFNSSPSSAGGGMTREPGGSANVAGNFSAIPIVSSSSSVTILPQITGVQTTSSVYAPGILGGKVAVYSNRDAATFYVPRAALLDCIAVPYFQTVISNGDNVTFNSKTYVRISGNGSCAIFVDTTV